MIVCDHSKFVAAALTFSLLGLSPSRSGAENVETLTVDLASHFSVRVFERHEKANDHLVPFTVEITNESSHSVQLTGEALVATKITRLDGSGYPSDPALPAFCKTENDESTYTIRKGETVRRTVLFDVPCFGGLSRPDAYRVIGFARLFLPVKTETGGHVDFEVPFSTRFYYAI